MKQKLLLFVSMTCLAVGGPNRPGFITPPDWVDLNEDGVIDENERQAFIEARKDASKGLFHKWDTNPTDGVIDAAEKDAAISELRTKATERRRQLFAAAAGDGLEENGEEGLNPEEFTAIHPVGKLPPHVVARLFGLLDTDHSGVVTEEEFLSAVGPAPAEQNPPFDPTEPDQEE